MVIRRWNSEPMPETERMDCKVCGKSNNVDDMVGCDRCREWYHFGCVGVDNSVAGREWLCADCEKLPVPPTTTSSTDLPPTTTVTTTNADAAQLREAQMKILYEQQDLLEREMEMQHEQELARKKIQLEKMMLKAKLEILGGTGNQTILSESVQSTGDGVAKVENWMKRLEIEAKNLSFAPQGETPKVTSSMPSVGRSSTPTSVAVSNVPQFDESLKPVSQITTTVQPPIPNLSTATATGMQNLSFAPQGETPKVTSSMPSVGRSSTPTSVAVSNVPQFDESLKPVSEITTTVQPPIPNLSTATATGMQNLDYYQQLGAIPKQVGYPSTSMGWNGLTFTQQSPIPTVGQLNPAVSMWGSMPIPTSGMMFPPTSLSSVYGMGLPPVTSNAFVPSSSTNPLMVPASVTVVNSGTPVVPTSAMPIPVPMTSMNPPFPVPVSVPGVPVPGVPPQPEPVPIPQQVGPSPQQLLARQVIPRELPTFDGNPDDWPMFYSSYVNSSTACGFSDVENLARLQKSIKGRALDAVKCRLLLPACVPQVIATLYTLFGRPELIIHTLLNKIREISAPKADRLDTLICFGTAVQNLCDHLEAAGQVAHLCNPVLLQELVDKVPAQLRLNWAMYKRQFPAANLRVFAQYMSMLVAAASDVTVVTDVQQKSAKVVKVKEKTYLNAHSEDGPVAERSKKEEVIQSVLCLVCNDPQHKVKDCGNFKKLDQDARWKVVQNHHLCRVCLGKHGKRPCKSQARCSFEGCQLRHHPLLHTEKDSQKTAKIVPKATDQAGNSTEPLNAHHHTKQAVLFRMLPVQLRWNGRMVETYAFLDDGSSLTLVNQAIVKQLGIDDGEPAPLCLSWTSNVTRYESKSQRVRIQICGVGMEDSFWLNDTRTVANLNLPEQTLDYGELSRRFSHLRGLPVRSYKSVSPGILIGSNNASLLASIKLHEGQLGDPIATKTRLGWTICGTAEGSKTAADFAMHICECTDEGGLHALVKQFFAMESVGVSAPELPESEEDQRARQILEQTTKRVPGGFETGLTWRHDHLDLPNSFPMAMKRWECFERRMEADPELKRSVHQQIKEYLEDGYIHVATPKELSAAPGKEWYLPLGAVRNPKKPGKIRLVWDAAAMVKGISLNSVLLKGPDFLVSLLTVLCGFRERKVAVSGDIKQMFHQYFIRQADRPYQKFLFRSNPSEAIQVYVLDVGSFGSTCSPSQAQFIKNRNAEEHQEQYPRAAKAITKKHYVDDYLDSFDSEQEAIEVATEVATVHARGGFTIRNWLSNSQAVLRRVGEPPAKTAKTLSFSAGETIEQVLGMLWEPRGDKFTYAVDSDLGSIPMTKRNILRCVMRFFDPLGLISHVLIHGKLIVQEAWREQLQWDEEVSGRILESWQKWIALLKGLYQFRIDRPYFPGLTSDEMGPLELHIFADASENAYACVAYFRAQVRGQICCSLIMAKAKVAPLKALSVPRLELQGALLGARLAKTICENHSLTIKRRFLWTDSTTVLAWIKSDHRRYRQFVAFRVGEILSKTEIAEWNYVPSKKNAADQATKWGKGPCLEMDSSWFRGPDFLYLPEEQWPKASLEETDESAEELRPSMVHRETVREQLIDFSRFSKWERLLRCVGYVKRFISNTRRGLLTQPRISEKYLSQEELEWAENYLWSAVQAETYPDEVAALKTGGTKKAIEKTSKIYRLSPFLDDRGVLRLCSTICNIRLQIPDSPAERASSDGADHRCLPSKVFTWEPRNHCERVQAAVPCVEIAYTCRTDRQELPTLQDQEDEADCAKDGASADFPTHSLPAPFLIHRDRLLRSVASSDWAKRREKGASRELRAEIDDMHKDLAGTFTNANTKWVFNPPSAPHFGGIWERLVRSVKTALNSLSSSRNPDDETLLTILVEAESIVNSRPLTFVPVQASDQEALTPNHFILLSSSGVVQPPRTLAETDRAARTNWDLARQQIDQFWTRWIREYLPTIAHRSKWHEESEPLKIGDLVVVVDEGTRNGWIRGRIASVIPGCDGRSRQAWVQTSTGLLRRPVSKLAVLAVEAAGKAEPEVQRYGSGDVEDAANDAAFPRPT